MYNLYAVLWCQYFFVRFENLSEKEKLGEGAAGWEIGRAHSVEGALMQQQTGSQRGVNIRIKTEP
jgi:hypothetical protein